MTSIIITFFVVISGIIWWIYHNEVAHEFDNIYNSITWKKIISSINSNSIDWSNMKWEKKLVYNDKNKDKLNLYHLLYVSNWLLNNWNKLLKDWFSLNSDLYKSIEKISELWKWLSEIQKKQLTNILIKYKTNIKLQKELIASEIKKKNCIEKYYSWFNKDIFIKNNVKKNIVKPSATKPSTTKPSATKPSTTKPSATKPSTTKPSATKPSATKPSTTKPSSNTF